MVTFCFIYFVRQYDTQVLFFVLNIGKYIFIHIYIIYIYWRYHLLTIKKRFIVCDTNINSELFLSTYYLLSTFGGPKLVPTLIHYIHK